MLRITKEADYGIMLLLNMSGNPDGQIFSAREAAASAGLSLPMAAKILRALAREGLVTSHRGANGGYRLEKRNSQTSVAEVIRAVAGPISLVQCGIEPGACERESCCPTRPHWARISREVERTLENIPISEMRPPQPIDPLHLTGSCGRATVAS